MPRDGSDTRQAVLETIRSAAWPLSVSEIADEIGTSGQTVRNHLQHLENNPNIDSRELGQTTIYRYEEQDLGVEDENIKVGLDPRKEPVSERVEMQVRSVKEWATDRFVGLRTNPHTAVHPNDGEAGPGEKVQLRVMGVPGDWSDNHPRVLYEDRRDRLLEEETVPGEANVLLSGTLYSKPTTPIEHVRYPADYDLEERKEMSPWLFEPCNDAVFLTDVEVEWISPIGHPRIESEPLSPGGESDE
ncbi:helix-turn-helix domain-containing protein [Halorubrum sp. SD683]|uniref:helix-turn-helix domain-containing protein n=1 Tax=Halorubrum sp. SD683 TaxID=1855873 RepID=UPI00117B2026|nr:winged helix-turn-helix domain-containing protein [Halorubrum sp. SD683]